MSFANLKLTLLSAAIAGILTGCSVEDGEQGVPGDQGLQGPVGDVGADGAAGQDGSAGKNYPVDLNIEIVGRFATGLYGQSAAEIVQFHKSSNSAFAVNSATNKIDVISLATLSTTPVATPVSDESLSSTAFTYSNSVSVKQSDDSDKTIMLGAANSIAIHGDLLAIAVEGKVKQDNGAVLFYELDALGNGTFIKAVEAGALPDMVTFTPDGSQLLVANEGEPASDYSVDPEGTISVINLTASIPADTAEEINFTSDLVFKNDLLDDEDYDTPEEQMALLQDMGVKFSGPAGNTAAKDLEPEYIAVSADSKIAYVSLQENNAIGVVDLTKMTVEVKPLGYKDWSQFELDFTNKDELPTFQSVPGLMGMYQPDSIATYTWNGATFIVSANEGDSRDYDAYSEEVRVADLIDPDEENKTLSTELQSIYDHSGGKDGLGRLKITTSLGDADNDGEFESLYSYGARSFSIWDQNINQVFDSGDEFGKISSAILGEYFNAAHTENTGDNRSDDKGGEPEAIEVGMIENRNYAFIAQERAGDLFVYDVTNPFDASFVAHYNNRDFDVDYEMDDDLDNPCDEAEGMDCENVNSAGDLGPESIKFVSAEDSPSGNPLLIIGNEVSGTVTIYQVTEK